MSDLLLGMVLAVRTCWFHNMVPVPSWLVYTDFGTWSYRCLMSNCIPIFYYTSSMISYCRSGFEPSSSQVQVNSVPYSSSLDQIFVHFMISNEPRNAIFKTGTHSVHTGHDRWTHTPLHHL